MRKKGMIIVLIIIFLYIVGSVIWNINDNNGKERERRSIDFFHKNEKYLEYYAKRISKFDKILTITRQDNDIEIKYVEKRKSMSNTPGDFKNINIQKREGKYINLSQESSSIDHALKSIDFNVDELRLWDVFMNESNIVQIRIPLDSHTVDFVLDGFWTISHGFLYVPEAYPNEWETYNHHIPGKSRGNQRSAFHVIISIGERWFYYEGD